MGDECGNDSGGLRCAHALTGLRTAVLVLQLPGAVQGWHPEGWYTGGPPASGCSLLLQLLSHTACRALAAVRPVLACHELQKTQWEEQGAAAPVV